MKDSLIILSLAAIFLVLISIVLVFITVSFRTYSMRRDKYYDEEIKKVGSDLAELKSLFRTEMSDVFTEIKNIIK